MEVRALRHNAKPHRPRRQLKPGYRVTPPRAGAAPDFLPGSDLGFAWFREVAGYRSASANLDVFHRWHASAEPKS